MTYRWMTVVALSMGVACAAAGEDSRDGQFDDFAGGKADGAVESGSLEARAVLELVNDPAVGFAELDDDAALDRRAADNIIAHRDGPDAAPGTADDDPFDALRELDEVHWVGPVALQQLLAYAVAHGYLDRVSGRRIEVVFSPQPYEDSHNVRVAALIDGAQHSLDIAMYSYSDAGIAAALDRAVARGVKVRFLFETANADRRETGSALESSKSARLERQGINVRYVNKIMHHKLAIADGPRDVAARAATARVVSGSGNWSYGAASHYDENTLLFSGYPELTLRLQREFNLLWEHSRDFIYDASLPYELSTYAIDDAVLARHDDPALDVLLTSDNFSVSRTTFRVTGSDNVASVLVEAIRDARRSIHVASGHLRSRPIAEALMARAAEDPPVDIRVYLDGQEHISPGYHRQQLAELDVCLAEAGDSEAQRRDCLDTGFLFGHQVGETDGIEVRYKYYAYRWHYSYAKQMHHKYLIVDGETLFTGSYNYSDNAEHNTFENVLVLGGPRLAPLVAAYERNFEALWETGRDEVLYDALLQRVATAAAVPLVFEPMALSSPEVTALDDAIAANCPAVFTEEYRRHPEDHWSCPRS